MNVTPAALNSEANEGAEIARHDAFDQWLDEQYGNEGDQLNIAGALFRPSDILFEREPAIYEEQLLEWQSSNPDSTIIEVEGQPALRLVTPVRLDDETLRDIVFRRYPSPIASSYWRFSSSPHSPLAQLGFLKDTWESLIYVLFGIIAGEFCCSGLDCADTSINKSRLWSYKLGIRLDILEQLLNAPQEKREQLHSLRLISQQLVENLKTLNSARNSFAHSPQRTERQAKDTIEQFQGVVLEALREALPLRDVRIVRYKHSASGMLSHYADFFTGNPDTTAVETFAVRASQLERCARYFVEGKVLVLLDEEFWSVAPFLHFRDQGNDPCPRLCFLKQNGDRPNESLAYGLVNETADYMVERAVFLTELNDLENRIPGRVPRGNAASTATRENE